MIPVLLAITTGWAFCLSLLAAFSFFGAPNRIQPLLETLLTPVAFAALISAFWLSSVMPRWPFHGAWVCCGFLVAPFCILPIHGRVSGRIEGLTRAASGLGAGPRARLRLLWLPLLRGPILLSCLISVAAFAICLALGRIAHV